MVVLSVIIVNYNVKYFIEQCLYAVYKAGRGIAMEVIVVDNHSADGSRDYLEAAFKQVQFYWLSENPGFAKACNMGLMHAKGSYILFLNPDTIISEDCLEKCIDFLNTHPQAGALGVRMIDEWGHFLKESKRAFPSPAASFFKLTGLARLFPRSTRFAKYYLGNLSEVQTHEVDVLAGAFMMIKKTVLDITGSFDEAFFMYGEDIDLSYRIQKQGYKNYYYPGVTILHFKGKSTPQKNMRYVRIFYRAMRVFAHKHYGKRIYGLYNACIQAAIGLRAAIANLLYWIKNNASAAKKLLNKIQTQGSSMHVLVTGDEKNYKAVLALINNANSGKAWQIDFLPAQQNAAEHRRNIISMLKKGNIKNIILCEGKYTFGEIIRLTEELGNAGIRVGIHAAGSKGIAGELFMEQ
jgi:GT2 family glycosyltransferase